MDAIKANVVDYGNLLFPWDAVNSDKIKEDGFTRLERRYFELFPKDTE